MSWDNTAIDITAAFLQAGLIKREVYVKPPADVCSNETVWHLKRCIYGLNDAPRSWYERVKEVLFSLGATISAYDNALLCGMITGTRNLFDMLVSRSRTVYTYCERNWTTAESWVQESWWIEWRRKGQVRTTESVSENRSFLHCRFCDTIWWKKVAFENFSTV